MKIDLREKLLSQFGIHIVLNQLAPDDTELHARTTMAGNFDFTPLVQLVDRHAGYEWHQVSETSENWQRQENWSQTISKQKSRTVSQQTSHQTGHSVGTGLTNSSQHSTGAVDTLSRPVENGSRPSQQSHADSQTSANGNAVTHSNSSSATEAFSKGFAQSEGLSVAGQSGGSESCGFSVSQKLVPLAKIVREPQVTGMLQTAFKDQLEMLRQWQACLPNRHAIVRVPWEMKAFEIFTADVPDPFVCIEAQMRAVDWVKKQLFQIHNYHFVPDLSLEEENRRLAEFVADVPDECVEPDVVVQRGETKIASNGQAKMRNGSVSRNGNSDVAYGF